MAGQVMLMDNNLQEVDWTPVNDLSELDASSQDEDGDTVYFYDDDGNLAGFFDKIGGVIGKVGAGIDKAVFQPAIQGVGGIISNPGAVAGIVSQFTNKGEGGTGGGGSGFDFGKVAGLFGGGGTGTPAWAQKPAVAVPANSSPDIFAAAQQMVNQMNRPQQFNQGPPQQAAGGLNTLLQNPLLLVGGAALLYFMLKK